MAYRRLVKERIMKRIMKDYNIKEIPEFSANSTESRLIIGEIGNSEEEALMLENVILINRDAEDNSGHETKVVSLGEKVENFSLFEGEIVCFEGTLDNKRFIVDKIIKPKPVTKIPKEIKGDVFFQYKNAKSGVMDKL